GGSGLRIAARARLDGWWLAQAGQRRRIEGQLVAGRSPAPADVGVKSDLDVLGADRQLREPGVLGPQIGQQRVAAAGRKRVLGSSGGARDQPEQRSRDVAAIAASDRAGEIDAELQVALERSDGGDEQPGGPGLLPDTGPVAAAGSLRD